MSDSELKELTAMYPVRALPAMRDRASLKDALVAYIEERCEAMTAPLSLHYICPAFSRNVRKYGEGATTVSLLEELHTEGRIFFYVPTIRAGRMLFSASLIRMARMACRSRPGDFGFDTEFTAYLNNMSLKARGRKTPDVVLPDRAPPPAPMSFEDASLIEKLKGLPRLAPQSETSQSEV